MRQIPEAGIQVPAGSIDPGETPVARAEGALSGQQGLYLGLL